jgi:acetyl-CoA carboxylase biotin carboxyl carrier protein
MDRKDLDALLKLLRRHGVAEFTLDEEDTSLSVKFAGASLAPAVTLAAPAAAPAQAASNGGAPAPRKDTGDFRVIRAPIVGTFYRSPAPDAPAYANVGDRVRKGQVVCIVEAMKLMNQIEADVDGVVLEILVENAAPVQFGQELFRLSPA